MDANMLDKDTLIPVLAIGCGSLIAIFAIVFGAVKAMVVSRNREQTKRELAAYVAEGTMESDKAVAIINAGRPHWEAGHSGSEKKCC